LQIEKGFYNTQDIFIVKGIPALIMRFDIQYPYTPENSKIYNEIVVLQRYYDENWIEVALCQIKPALDREIKVLKHNYQNDFMKYSIEDFEKADKRNSEIDSLNNHITNGFEGVEDDKKGVVICANRFILSSRLCQLEAIFRLVKNIKPLIFKGFLFLGLKNFSKL